MSERTPEEIARDLMYDIKSDVPMFDPRVHNHEVKKWYEDSIKAITSALAAERAQPQVPEGHVMLSDGQVVKVLGRPVETGDGAWVFPGAKGLYQSSESGEDFDGWTALTTGHPDHVEHSHFTWIGTDGMGAVVSTSLFSTREAAIAAKGTT